MAGLTASAGSVEEEDRHRPLDLDVLLAVTRRAAEAGARRALGWWEHPERLDIREKLASDDLVSQADQEAEEAIRSVLEHERPADGLLGEEGGATPGTTGIEWVIDPIDGTTNYLYGRPDWGVSVAAVRRRDSQILTGVVIEPALGRRTEARLGGGTRSNGRIVDCSQPRDLSRALVELNLGRGAQRNRAGRLIDALKPRVRDIRRGGSASSALAQVATGRAEAYWGPGLQAWDGSAGALLVVEAGGTVGDLAGPSSAAWPASGDILAAAPALWEPLRALLSEVYLGGGAG
jgi:myo-inositol-1(or 4)-monophosphatase